jgi:hypothetical protein
MSTMMQKVLKTGYKLLSFIGISGDQNQDKGRSEVELQLSRAQSAWLRHMKSLKSELGIVILPDNTPDLTSIHLANCKVLPNREMILQQMKKGGIGAEVGVQEGLFSRLILQLCEPKELHLIDFDLTHFLIEKKFRSEIDSGQVKLHESDSSLAISKFPDAYFDFIYIDADHTYQGVHRDIQAAKTKIKEDGFLLFNDYTYWSPGECINYGVVQAVNELCVNENWEMIYFAFGGYMYCDVAIRKLR